MFIPLCRRKKFKDEEAVKKAIWAMAQNKRGSDKFYPEKCDVCKNWHIGRK